MEQGADRTIITVVGKDTVGIIAKFKRVRETWRRNRRDD